ncbi:MAG: methionine ABC transporter permease [Oscillospiraceae bacterium]
MFDAKLWGLLGQGTLETLYMVIASTAMAYVLGLPLGVLLVVTDRGGIKPKPVFSKILGIAINLLRSVPFIILLIAITPLTRAIVGKAIGTSATVIPLIVSAAPFVARMVESSMKEIDRGVVEAARSMGAGTMQIICKVLLPEAKPSLIVGSAIAITTILGYTAMAGFVGGGGLGQIAISYGYNQYRTDVMLITVFLIVIIVQLFQEIGMRITKKVDKRLN